MRRPRLKLIPFTIVLIAAVAPAARSEYAVLQSGQRLHITGYQRLGDTVRMTVAGGSIEVPSDALVSIEPEDRFEPIRAPVPEVPYGKLIAAAAATHGVAAELVASVIAVESNFNPRAVSARSARGLMQLMPQTAARFQVADLFDPEQNIGAGTQYLRELLDRYHGDLSLALAAYNAGPQVVERYGAIPPYRETVEYVRRVKQKYLRAQARRRTPAGD